MKKKIIGTFVCMLLITAGTIAVADWDPEDGHKMHYPQTPDPNGWDVYCTAGLAQWLEVCLADDWECSESGYIKDIHFWGSWWEDHVGQIDYFVMGVAENIPAEQNPLGDWSCPGETLVEWQIDNWVERGPYTGNQGWYWGYENLWLPNDHQLYWQYNVFLDEGDWFWQEEGVIYWLFISAIVVEEPTFQPLWGWKSTLENLHFMDDAVWARWYQLYWMPLTYPTGVTMDLAFVITGGEECEPGVDVEKYVLDPVSGNWIDADTASEALDLKIGSIVEFKIVIHNNGTCVWSGTAEYDYMEDSLKPVYPPLEQWNYNGTHYCLEWGMDGPIDPGWTNELFFKAEVVGEHCETDYNKVIVKAGIDFVPDVVSDEDYAYVHAEKKARELNRPIFNFLENYQNLFPLLRLLLQRLGL